MKKKYIVPAQQCVSLGLDNNVAEGGGLMVTSDPEGGVNKPAMVRGEEDFDKPIEDEFYSPKNVWEPGW